MDPQNVRLRFISSSSLSNFRQISPAAQDHLLRVYLTLCGAFFASAFGAYLHMHWNIGGQFSLFGCAGTIYWFFYIPPSSKRICLLFLTALLKGASDGPIIKFVVDYDTSILITAYVGIAVSYVCFTATAVMSTWRREYHYLGALLTSGMMIRWWIQLASSIFGGSTSALKFELYFGLLVYLGCTVVDTQVLVEKAERGDVDFVKHSFTIFTYFVGKFGGIFAISRALSSLKSLMDLVLVKWF